MPEIPKQINNEESIRNDLNLENESKEQTIKFEIYSTDNMPHEKTAEEISNIFIENYPTMYPEELKESDFVRYNSSEKIQKQVKDGNIFITVKVNDKMVGMTKFRQEQRTDFSDCEEWLGSWIMVDKPYRELGIGEKIFQKGFEILSDIKKTSGKRMSLVVDVNKNNIASINLCKKMGLESESGKSSEYFLFRKEIME